MHFMITGGAGFIGSHLTEHLLSENHKVTIVDNLTTGSLKNLPKHPRLRILQKDILLCQPENFLDSIDGIAHLAGIPSVTASWSHPRESHEHNLSATIAVIELCQNLNIPRLVLASSAAVYGNTKKLPLSENLNPNPTSPYGFQKLASEQYACLFAKKIDFSFISLRLFNVFGPRQLPKSEYSGVISIFTQAMAQGLPITIYGDGTQTRDFVYVKDVARSFAQALTNSLSSGSNLICNIGSGKTTSVLALVDILKSYFPQWNSEIRFVLPRSGEIQYSQADILIASSFLNFTTQWHLEDALRDTVASITSN